MTNTSDLSDVILKAVIESLDPAAMQRILSKIQGHFDLAPKHNTDGAHDL